MSTAGFAPRRTDVTAPMFWMTPEQVWERRVTNSELPLWLRVAAYAEAHAGPDGHCPLWPEQLHQAVDPTIDKAMLSRAINKAVDLDWLHPASSARCLVLGVASRAGDCPATHRDRPS